MRRAAVGLILLAACANGPAPAAGGSSKSLEHAIAAFNAARFDEAEARVREAVAANAKDGTALRLLGRLLALRNRTTEAAAAYAKAAQLSLDPRLGYTDGASIEELAWVLYRMDEYSQAANWFEVLKDSVLSTKYRTMAKGKSPYTCRWRGDSSVTRITYFQGLPTVEWHVNGERGIFVVDTGGGELALDHAFARRVRAQVIGTRQDIRGMNVEHAIVDTVDAGGLTVANVPAQLASLKRKDGPPIDGLIGASFLMHFGIRFDFKNSNLVLSPPGKGRETKGTSAPLFVAGDRYLVVEATVEIDKGQGAVPVRVLLQFHTGRKVAFAPSASFARELPKDGLKRVTVAGSMRLPEKLDPSVFPGGLDFAYGFPIAGLVGPEFFSGKNVTLDFEAMKFTVE